MVTKIVEYLVKPEKIDTALPAMRTFLASVRREEPRTKYHAYRRGNTFAFIHLMEFSDGVAEEAHRSAPYTMQFVETLYPCCEQEPQFTDVNVVI